MDTYTVFPKRKGVVKHGLPLNEVVSLVAMPAKDIKHQIKEVGYCETVGYTVHKEEPDGYIDQDTFDIEELEHAMYANASGLITSTELRMSFDKLGWKVDLHKWANNTLEAVSPSGKVYILAC